MSLGEVAIGEAPYFEDLKSLKEWIRKQHRWNSVPNQIGAIIAQTGSAGDIELEEKSGETIADIGKVGVTWVAQISAWAENVVVSLTWKNAAGVSTTQTIQLTDANETAFTVPITTGYCATACSIDVVNPGGVTVKVGVTGMATPVATVQAAATVALEADLSGTGKVMMVQKTDQVGTDGGKDGKIQYVTPWGEVKFGFSTMNAVATTTEVVWYEASSAYAPTSVIVKDFYRRRKFEYEIAATDEVLIVAVGGATVYAVIKATAPHSLHSRYTCPAGRDAWIAQIQLGQSISTNKNGYMKFTFVPFGETLDHTIQIPIPNNALSPPLYPMVRLAENTEVKFEIKGDAATATVNLKIIEAIQV